MRVRHLSATPISLTISLLLIVLFAAPAPAITNWRESNLKGGWQIWIEAVDFNRRGAVNRRGDDRFVRRGRDAGVDQKAPPPVLAGDFLFSTTTRAFVLKVNGFPEYDFVSPHAGDAHIYARVMSFAPDRSWYIGLAAGDVTHRIDTPNHWEWKTDVRADLGQNFVRPKLIQGVNTLRVLPRNSFRGGEVLMDIIVVSTVEFQPTDRHYKQAQKLAVEPAGKLATTWGTIKAAD